MSQKSKQQLRQTNNANFPNNNSAFITPEKLREFNNDIIDSVALDENTELSGSVVISGSLSVTGAITGDISASTDWNSITNKPAGIVSGSSQIDLGSATGTAANATSASYAVTASHALNAGASDWSDITNKPSGLVSSSSQVQFNNISGVPSGLVSGSSQIDLSQATGVAVSSSYAVTSSHALNGGVTSIIAGTNISLDQSTGDVTISAVGGATDTGSLLVTASVTDATITFTKGDASTFGITVNNVVSASHALNADNAIEIFVQAQNTSGFDIPKGYAVHSTGVTGDKINITTASYDDPTLMPAIGITQEAISNNAVGEVILTGRIQGINTANLTEGQTVYVNGDGSLTSTRPTGSALIQNIGTCVKSNATEGEILVLGAGRSNDLPNITQGYTWVGDSNGVPQPIATSSLSTGSFAIPSNERLKIAGGTIATGVGSIGFYSSSNFDPADGWLNIQPEPGGAGRVAVAWFPENHHLMFFDPNADRVEFEAAIKSNGNNPLSVATDLQVTGSIHSNGIGIFSGSSQVDVTQTTNISTIATTGSNTFQGNQTVNGSIQQNITAPALNNQIDLIALSGASVGGDSYPISQLSVQDYSGFGNEYEDAFVFESWASAYAYGSEFTLNGQVIKFETTPSGSSSTQRGQLRIDDDGDGTSTVKIDGNDIEIGTRSGVNNRQIRIGSTGDALTVNTYFNSAIEVRNNTTPQLILTGSSGSSIKFNRGALETTLQTSGSTTLGLEVTDNFRASKFFGDGSTLSGIPTTGSNTFVGDQNVTGRVKQTLDAPADFNQEDFIIINNASVAGNSYPITQFTIQDYTTWAGTDYEDAFVYEYWSTGYGYGSEISINGIHTKLETSPSGSGFSQRATLRTQDNQDGTSTAQIEGNTILLGNTGRSSLIKSATEISSSNAISASFFIGDGSKLQNLPSAGGGIFAQTGSFYATTNDLQITGSLGVSKAIGGKNTDLTISTNTASIDLTQGNTFTVTLVSSADTHLDVSTFGEDAQSINVLVKQPAAGNTGSISFSPDFKFGQGYSFVPTSANSSEDIVSFTRFGNFLYGTYINNFS